MWHFDNNRGDVVAVIALLLAIPRFDCLAHNLSARIARVRPTLLDGRYSLLVGDKLPHSIRCDDDAHNVALVFAKRNDWGGDDALGAKYAVAERARHGKPARAR